MTKLAIVIPCFNEEENLSNTILKLSKVMEELFIEQKIAKNSFIILVDDGSRDKTWKVINELHKKYQGLIKAIRFSRNYGNQAAITAGLEAAQKNNVDAALVIDADLQQDENKIGAFVDAYKDGYDIVAGVRNDRDADTFLKRVCSAAFYKFINLLGVNIKFNHSEFRLVSKNALEMLSSFNERHIFLRGLFNELGLETKYIAFDVKKREFGKSKFSFVSLLKLAIDAIVSFSVYPLRLVFVLGVLICIASLFVALIILFDQLLNFTVFKKIEFFKIWISFICGIQILCTGIIGEYIGQVLLEVKGRPRYIISKSID